jgi:hypothetical protein
VYKRPFVDECLLRVRHSFELAVWTSSSPSYASPVVRALFPYPNELAFVWASDRCTAVFDPDTRQYHRTKKLEKLKRKGLSAGQRRGHGSVLLSLSRRFAEEAGCTRLQVESSSQLATGIDLSREHLRCRRSRFVKTASLGRWLVQRPDIETISVS